MILIEFRRLSWLSSVGIERENTERREYTGAGGGFTGVDSRAPMCLALQDELTKSIVDIH